MRALVTASAAVKYAAASTSVPGTGATQLVDGLSASRRTQRVGRGHYRAASIPRSDSTAGWMPEARSRISASALDELAVRRVEQGRVTWLFAQEPQGDADGEQPLLGSVMQVTLEPGAGVVAGTHDSGARLAHLQELGADLSLQAHVLQDKRVADPAAVSSADSSLERAVVPEQRERCLEPRRRPSPTARTSGSGASVR